MWRDLRAGMGAAAPMLVGVVPFGLVAGASPVAEGMSGLQAVGFSTILFAGASQLAAIDVLGDGGSALVAVVAACAINLRILLYSASLAPHLSHVPLGQRLFAAYLLVDQNYALSISRWDGTDPPERRLPYFLGAGALLWTAWQLATIVGVLVGGSVPDDVPLDFAVPLVFLVLLVPVLGSPPALAAGIAGGGGAVLAAEVGATDLSVLLGALAGIAAGVLAEIVTERRGPAPLLEESS